MIKKSEDGRYPYTYACDMIRSIAGYNENGMKLSRSDASRIRSFISEILNLSDEFLAEKIADHYLENEKKISEESSKEFLSILKNPQQFAP